MANALNGKTILLVEDDALVSRMYERRLKTEGAKVVLATNGLDGLDKLRKEKPGLILLDLMMPKMNGYEMLKEAQKNADTKNIPVLILTNLTDRPEDIKKVKELGVKEYLIKSEISLAQLVEKAAQYLK